MGKETETKAKTETKQETFAGNKGLHDKEAYQSVTRVLPAQNYNNNAINIKGQRYPRATTTTTTNKSS